MRSQIAQEIVSRVSMRDVFVRYGFTPNRAGFIRCPFHTEKTPSLGAYKNGTRFHCFGCGAGGSVIDFVMQLYHLTYMQAVVKLNADFGLCLPIGGKPSLRQRREAAAREQERKRQAEKERIAAQIQQAYEDIVWLEYSRLEYNRRVYAPKKLGEELHPLFVEALQKMSYYEYLIDEIELDRGG